MLASSQGELELSLLRNSVQQGPSPGIVPGRWSGGTDGVDYVPVPLSRRYPLGLLVVQNGDAPEPSTTGDINGYAFDGATQFKYVNFLETLKALRD